jgi:hypothetical protein
MVPLKLKIPKKQDGLINLSKKKTRISTGLFQKKGCD